MKIWASQWPWTRASNNTRLLLKTKGSILQEERFKWVMVIHLTNLSNKTTQWWIFLGIIKFLPWWLAHLTEIFLVWLPQACFLKSLGLKLPRNAPITHQQPNSSTLSHVQADSLTLEGKFDHNSQKYFSLNKNACYDTKSNFDTRTKDGQSSPFGTNTFRFFRPLELSKLMMVQLCILR